MQNPGQILPNGLQHPVKFAKDVAKALEFLHQNEVFIDFNLQLITEYRIKILEPTKKYKKHISRKNEGK